MTPSDAPARRRWVWRVLIVVAVLLAAGVVTLLSLRPSLDKRLFTRGKINLAHGHSAEAVADFRKALQLKPDHMAVRLALIQALKVRKAFPEALAELDIAVEKGLADPDAKLARAVIFSSRGLARVQEAGKAAEPPLIDSVLADDLGPAIQILKDLSQSPDATLQVFMALGDLYSQQASFLSSKRVMLAAERDQSRKLQNAEEAAAKDAEVLGVLREVTLAQNRAIEAYEQGTQKDPKAFAPRAAIARYALGLFVPNTDKARSLLEPILQDTPDDRAALALLAKTEDEAGNWDKALKIVQSIRAKDPQDVQMMLFELGLLVEAEKWDQAGPLADTVAKQLLPRQSHTDALEYTNLAEYCCGLSLLHNSRPADAAVYLQDLFTANPDIRWPKARFALAQALEAVGDREQALANYRKVLVDVGETNPANIRAQNEAREAQYQACLALIRMLKTEDPRTVAQCALTALEIYPLRSEPLDMARDAFRADHYTGADLADLVIAHAAAIAAAGKLDEALGDCRTQLDSGTDSDAGKARLRDMIARLLAAKGDYLGAAAAYEELWRAFPRETRYGQELAALKVRLGQTAEARKIYEDLLKLDPKDPLTLNGLLSLLVRSGDLAGARALVAHSVAQLGPDATASFLTGLALLSGRTDEAISIARQYAQQRPNFAPAQAALAELLWIAGDLPGARAAFDAAIKADPRYPPAYRRALLDLQQDRDGDALSLCREACAQLPSDISLRVLLMAVLQADGKTDEAVALAEKLLANVTKPAPAADPPRWALAVMDAGQGKLQDALAQNSLIAGVQLGTTENREALLSHIASLKDPDRAEAARSLNLLTVFISASCPAPALSRVEALQKLLPGEPAPECWYAGLLSHIGRQADALERYERLLREHPDLGYICELIAQCRERSGDLAGAVQMMQRALQSATGEHAAWVQIQLADLYEKRGDLDRAVTCYRNAAASDTWAAVACNNLAYLLATKKHDLVAALPLAEQAARLSGNSPGVQDTLGWIYFLKGDADKAVPLLESAKAALPSTPTVRYHLGMAYLRADRRPEAKAEFQEALTLSRTFPEADQAAESLNGL